MNSSLIVVVNWNYVNRATGGVTHIYDEDRKITLCGRITPDSKGWEALEGNINDAGCKMCQKAYKRATGRKETQ